MLISPNITIFEEGFGEFDSEVIPYLLRHVDMWLSSAAGIEPFSSRMVYVCHSEHGPMCCLNSDSSHTIILLATGNYWLQWVFQFAHEYCHHLIDGPMGGDTTGLLWFEEVLCHTASLYALSRLEELLTLPQSEGTPQGSAPATRLKYLAPSVRSYIANCHQWIFYTARELRQLVAEGHLDIREGVYPRKTYNIAAASILPLFQGGSTLWRIIPHIGNIRQYPSLDTLFAHLLRESDTTYTRLLLLLRSFFL